MSDPFDQPLLARLSTALSDRYTIEREIGSGGMAVVFLADDIRHDRKVALKVFRPELSSALGPERFLREIRIAAQLQHPHILPLHDSGEASGLLYYVMPYVEGETLQQLLARSGALPLPDAVHILREVIDALASAHGKGVVHRDIKPGNILLSGGHAFVSDFGIAKAVSEATGRHDLTTAGVALGTPAYMSPEQATGDPTIDHRADIYAIGTLAYEMLAGTPPFHGTTPQQVLAAHVTQQPEPLAHRRSGLPRPLADLVMRCLRKDPALRWQSAADILPLLDAAATTQNGMSSPARPQRRSVRLAIFGTAVVVLAGLGVLLRRDAGPAPASGSATSAAIAVLPFSVRGSGDFDYLSEGMVNLLGTKLDGAGELRSVDPRALLGYVEREGHRVLDPERGRIVADRFGANLYILGDVLEAGGRLRISASIYDARRGTRAIGEGSAEGSAEELFDLVDHVAAELLVSLRGGPGARVARIAGVTTPSLDAYRAYLEGETAFRAGQFEQALDAFERAIANDTLFALAYYRKSIAAEWLTRTELMVDAAEKALKYADRLSEHDKRFLEGFNAWRRGHHQAAEEAYRSILGTYPDDVEAWSQLGEVLFHSNPLHGRAQAESREAFRRVLSYEPDDGAALVHLTRTAAAEGRLDEMDSLATAFLRLAPEGDRALEVLALQAFAHGDPQRESQVIERLTDAGDVTLSLAALNAFAWTNQRQSGTRLTELMTRPTRSAEVRAVGHIWTAYLDAAMGKLDKVRAELAASQEFDAAQALEYRAYLATLPFLPYEQKEIAALRDTVVRTDWTRIPSSGRNPSLYFSAHYNLRQVIYPYLAGALSIRLGDTAEALRRAGELERAQVPPDAGSMAQDLALSLRSRVAHAAGRTVEALELIQRTRLETNYQLTLATPFAGQAFERFWRAEMLSETGQDLEALQW
ncbi:MAG TPA: protein kinase, partial [Gemmatimonadales bacterium]|nr:protein kinase [Gemmatimonadales bacterium]